MYGHCEVIEFLLQQVILSDNVTVEPVLVLTAVK